MLAAACGGESRESDRQGSANASKLVDPGWRIDLATEQERARLRAERSKVDFRFREALAFFEGGWKIATQLGPLRSNVFGVGTRSTIELFVAQPRKVALRLVCEAQSVPGIEQRGVRVSVGGQVLKELVLERRPREAMVTIPASALRRGTNQVGFEYLGPVALELERPGKEDRQTARMGCAEIEVRGMQDAEQPHWTDRGVLRLPARSAVDFFLDLPADARLDLRGVESSGATLAVEIESTTAEIRQLELPRELPAGGPPVDLVLPLTERGLVRVSLYALGEQGAIDIGAAGIAVGAAHVPPATAATTESGAGGESSAPAGSRRPNIIVYLVDTLRRDRLGVYGYQQPTSPYVDEFAGQAVRFDHAVAQAPWTTPAVASLFTGLEPQYHGANHFRMVLPPQAITVAELLAAAGYATVAFSGSKPICPERRFDQGFERFEDLGRKGGGIGPDSPFIIAEVEEWLRTSQIDRPLFLYVHTVDPHSPYEPAAEFRERLALQLPHQRIKVRDMLEVNREAASALYDGEVAAADAGFGRFVAALKQRGLYDDSLIIFIADHGEQFMEHGGWRHEALWTELIDIPLLVKLPAGVRARTDRVAEVVGQIDLLPTIADLVGAEVPREVQGQSLLPLMLAGRGRFEQRPIHSHVKKGYKEAWSVVDPPFKLIWRWYRDHREVHLFKLEEDPGETVNLAEQLPVPREYYKRVIERERFGREPLWKQPKDTPAEELNKQMEALGYVQ